MHDHEVSSPVSISEVFEREIFDVLDQVFVARMNWQLLEDLDEDETEDELDGQVAFLGHELELGSGKTQFAEIKRKICYLIHSFACEFMVLFICLWIHVFIHLFLHSFDRLFIHLFIHLNINLFNYLFINLFICSFFHFFFHLIISHWFFHWFFNSFVYSLLKNNAKYLINQTKSKQ